ncbi:uracil-DNA glycosylase [Christiangramia echinicola]|uniref:Uracil-DNA glycosylase n=1 Tax=Christiangramia echinicola TaxID=279359 RepID=A0A1H1RSH6_9FLAO|nr:uracil-DNA glycosylase [Christiangramia echinicola]SDS38622.1 Uracil-DNA glycosylase [Christiangramia echinicola]
MNVRIHESWKKELNQEFEEDYFKNLINFVKEEYTEHKCFPPGNEIFSAFDHSTFEDTKVVILGQDPYHGNGQANGLCFSVRDEVKFPPSLINIFKEIESDLKKPIPATGNLERWADQGVLLLNATLTVRAHQAGSHQKKGWEEFTDNVLKLISDKKENVVFMLWGGYAKKKARLIDDSKHLILTTGHPSPLSANRGYWFGNKHFSKTNEYLKEKGAQPIDW